MQIASIINAHSDVYEASVPSGKVAYRKVEDGKMVSVACHVLMVRSRGKRVNHVKRESWLIYAVDMEKIVRRVSRHKPEIMERWDRQELMVEDVELIVRRASFMTLRLGLKPLPSDPLLRG